MRLLVALACLGLVGCTTVGDGFDRVKQTANGLAARLDGVFGEGEDPAALYGGMSDTDVVLAVEAMRVALETKPAAESVSWTNDATGNQGSITPRRTFITDLGVFCREYDEQLSVDGRDGVVQNTACRTDDGAWTWAS